MKQGTVSKPSQGNSGMSVGTMVPIIIGAIVGLVFVIGAAKLSYDRYGSFAWAFLAFLFAPIYYPYYAFFVSSRVSMFGGRRR